MTQINPRSFADAKQLGDSTYELILTNWGNFGSARDPNNASEQYPPIKSTPAPTPPGPLALPNGAIPIVGEWLLPPLPSVFAIAIAPRSDLDRCILNFPALPQFPAVDTPEPYGPRGLTGKSITIAEGFVNYGGILETEQFLSVNAPLIGQINGPILVRAHTFAWFKDGYTPLDPAGTQRFGTALNEPFSTSGVISNFQVPELRLLLYLTSKSGLPPQKRAPLHRTFNITPIYPAAGIVGPWVVPIMGRRHVVISARSTSAGPVTVNAGGVMNSEFTNFGSTADFSMDEVPLGTVTIAANGGGVITIDNPGCPFLTVQASGGGLFDFMTVNVDAFD
jgi:hypothetical protein